MYIPTGTYQLVYNVGKFKSRFNNTYADVPDIRRNSSKNIYFIINIMKIILK